MNPSFSLPSSQEIDAIVQAVMVELNRRTAMTPSVAALSTSTLEPSLPVFGGKLLGVAQVETIAVDTAEVRVVPGTVVTPLALDLLKRRKIKLTYVSGQDIKKRETGEWAFAIDGRTTGQAEALRRSLLASWLELSVSETVPWLLNAPHRGSLLLTTEASVACWRANRIDGVRAATAHDPEVVSRAVRHLGVNLLVIEPIGLSLPFVNAMAETFRRGGAPSRPEGLR
jgi:hypothetical protein